ncbi:MAG: redoxin domain-containing protein [Verrucomicrobiales bacterium]
MALSTGSKAPDFTLKQKTANGLVDVTLSANFGQRPTVLLFFPFAFTGVCTEEMCSVTQGLSEYESLNAAVYAISVDNPFAQDGWAKANAIGIPVLSDFNKAVSTAYDVLYADFIGFHGVSKRSAFVISKDGTVVYSESSDDAKVLPNFAAIKEALKNA